jgi:hypothetical protein
MQKILDKITTDAQEALGGNLTSLVLYGSHARGEAHKRSDINLLIVVRDSRAESLMPLIGFVPGWMKQGAASPVIFEEAQLLRSHDTFALELAEMACVHRVLAGRDPFEGYLPDWTEVRSELEHESRQKTIYLKRRWFASGGKDKALLAMISETTPGFLVLLRGALMLHRRTVALLTVDHVLNELRTWSWFKPEVWRMLHGIARGTQKPASAELGELVKEYIEQARAFVRYVDQMPEN